MKERGFPDSSDGKESACKAQDLGSIPGSERSPGAGNDYPPQYSCLEKSMDRGAWRAIVHAVSKKRKKDDREEGVGEERLFPLFS